MLATVRETEPVREILTSDGIVLVHSRNPLAGATKRRAANVADSSTLFAVDGDTGKVLWKKEVRPINRLMLAIDAGHREVVELLLALPY